MDRRGRPPAHGNAMLDVRRFPSPPVFGRRQKRCMVGSVFFEPEREVTANRGPQGRGLGACQLSWLLPIERCIRRGPRQTFFLCTSPSLANMFNLHFTVATAPILFTCQSNRALTAFSSPTGTRPRRERSVFIAVPAAIAPSRLRDLEN